MYDGALPEADWFDAKNQPQASSVSTAIRAGEIMHNCSVVGSLTLRGITQPVNSFFRMFLT